MVNVPKGGFGSLDRWPTGSSINMCGHLALRSRVAARRGGRGSATEFAWAAVDVAMEEHVALMAVLVGLESGEEGVMLMENAAKQMDRPRDVVLQELAQARGDGPEQSPPELCDGT